MARVIVAHPAVIALAKTFDTNYFIFTLITLNSFLLYSSTIFIREDLVGLSNPPMLLSLKREQQFNIYTCPYNLTPPLLKPTLFFIFSSSYPLNHPFHTFFSKQKNEAFIKIKHLTSKVLV